MAEDPKVQPEGEPMQLEGATEGATEPGAVAPEQTVDLDALVATLDKIGVRDAQHLEGLHRTAQAHGPTANELGQARQQIENLQREVEMLKRGPTPRQQDPYADPYAEGQPIDLRSEVRAAVREEIRPELRNFYQDEVMKPQQASAEAYWRDVEGAESSEYFPMVEQEYREHLSKPAIQRALAQGRTSHTNELHKLVGAKFRELGQNLKSAANLLKGQQPQGATPPHMETGQIAPDRLPEGEQAKTQALKDISEKGRGTDDDLDAMIRTLLPDDDPILRE
jgi:hypothetical protein